MAEAVKRLQLNWSSIQTELETVHYQNLYKHKRSPVTAPVCPRGF